MLMLNLRVPGPREGFTPIAGETPGALVSSQPARHSAVSRQKRLAQLANETVSRKRRTVTG
jgi:hypothetical protein